MIRAFLRAGHEVLVCAPKLSGEVRATLNEWGVATESIPMERQSVNPLDDLQTLWSLYRTFRQWDADRVFAYNVKPSVYGPIAGWAAGARPFAMVTGLGYAFTAGTARARLVRAVMRVLYRISFTACDGVIFHNPDDRDRVREARALPEGTPTTIVAGSGVDTDRFARAPLPDQPIFLCMARLLAEKGIREYVAAARQVKERYPEARFQLAGWVDSTVPDHVTREELRQWEQEGLIEYLGYLDDVRDALANASVYVLPSYREGTPRSVLEAMAVGRPIITTDAPGCRETVEPGANGWLVPPQTIDELGEAMQWMVEHPSERQRMAKESRRRATEIFDVNTVNRDIMDMMSLDAAVGPTKQSA